MNLVAAAADLAAIIGAVWLVLPAAHRTGLGIWHPAIAWLGLEVVFFGTGAAILAIAEGRSEPALYVAGALLAFAVAVSLGDRVARRAAPPTMARDSASAEGPSSPRPHDRADAVASGSARPVVIAGLVVLGLVALIPTLLAVGVPFLAGDITSARSEIGGLDLQVLRVALPAAVVVLALAAVRSGDRRTRLLALVVFAAAVVAELALASRYLSVELAAALVLALGISRRPIPTRALVLLGSVAAILFVGVGIIRAYDLAAGREVAFAADRTVNRILLIEPRTLDALQTVIPAEQPFFDGLTWLRRLGPLLGRNDVPNLGYWIYPRLFPDQAIPGYAAPGLIGEAWANFGWSGLAIFAALGLLVERIGALIALRRRELVDVTAAALLTLFVARTHALGLNGLAVAIALVVGWRLVAAPLHGLAGDVRRVARWRV